MDDELMTVSTKEEKKEILPMEAEIVTPVEFVEPPKTKDVTGRNFLYNHQGDFPILNIPYTLWLENYNLDVTPYLEKSYSDISYLSWSFAWMLLKSKHPTFMLYWERDWRNNGRYYFQDSPKESPYILAFVADMETGARSLPVYFAILDQKMRAITGTPTGNLLNKNLMRAAVKAIAMTTGIGLRLWTGEDIDQGQKAALLDRIRGVNDQYKALAKKDHPSFSAANLGVSEDRLKEIGKEIVASIKELSKSKDPSSPQQ